MIIDNEIKSTALTFDEIEAAIKSLPHAPKFSDLDFVVNAMLPDNKVMVSPKLMNLLKEIFNQQ